MLFNQQPSRARYVIHSLLDEAPQGVRSRTTCCVTLRALASATACPAASEPSCSARVMCCFAGTTLVNQLRRSSRCSDAFNEHWSKAPNKRRAAALRAPAHNSANPGPRCGRSCVAPMSRPPIMTLSARRAPCAVVVKCQDLRPHPLTSRGPFHCPRLLGGRDLSAPRARRLRVSAASRHRLA